MVFCVNHIKLVCNLNVCDNKKKKSNLVDCLYNTAGFSTPTDLKITWNYKVQVNSEKKDSKSYSLFFLLNVKNVTWGSAKCCLIPIYTMQNLKASHTCTLRKWHHQGQRDCIGLYPILWVKVKVILGQRYLQGANISVETLKLGHKLSATGGILAGRDSERFYTAQLFPMKDSCDHPHCQ